MGKLDEFIEYLNEQVNNHSIYVWGGQGQKGAQITEAWIRSRENSAANANRAIAYWKKQVAAGYGAKLAAFDCSGLGIYWLFNLQHLYPDDTTANGMYGKCKQKLTRTTFKKGDWVFRGSASKKTHIGYIVDDSGTVIEAQGRDAGVCKSKVTSKTSGGAYYWQYFARPDVFKGEIEGGIPAPTPEPVSKKLSVTSPYRRGNDIKQLQEALIALGYPCGTADGIFGNNTKKALELFINDQFKRV